MELFEETVFEIAKILKYIKLNFLLASDYNGNFDIAKAQEAELISKLCINPMFNKKYVALTTQQFSSYNNILWKPKYDLENGDIVIVDKQNNPIMFIDLKVATNDKSHGCVNLKSLLNFGKVQRNHFYLLSNSLGNLIFVSGQKLFETVIKTPIIFASKNKNKEKIHIPELNNIISHGWNNKEHNITVNSDNTLYDADYISEKIYLLNPQINILNYVK